MSDANPMSVPRLGKVVVNMGVGEGAEKLQNAEKVLRNITKRKPARTFARTSVRDWSVRPGMPIGCKVTLRGEEAMAFLKEALAVRNNKVGDWSFDRQGNCSFGIADHTDFEGQKYDPAVGIFGMDIAVVIERPGERVKRRRILPSRIAKHHRVTRDEAKAFMTGKFQIEVVR